MRKVRTWHSGQAMVETVLAVLVISFAFLVLFRLSQMLTGKIMLEHAAMRVARARTVGLNRFMCEKAGRVAVIPVAGKRLWPAEGEFDSSIELARVPIYMATPSGPVANGVLEYEGWHRLQIKDGDGRKTRVRLGFSVFGDNDDSPPAVKSFGVFQLEGKARLEENCQLYLNDEGR